MNKILVWDFPTRVFHWSLVSAISFSVYTGLNGGFKEMDYHMYSGYFILSLVIFRIAWGFLSTGNARFGRFITSPSTVISYARAVKNQKVDPYPGHNPLGGLSVLSILFILLVQTMTGLFANDDILVEGPLVHLVSEELSNQLTSIHHISIWFLGGLIILHLSAIVIHEVIFKHKLIIPMLSGKRSIENGSDEKKSPEGRSSSEERYQEKMTQRQQMLLALILITLSSTLVYAVVVYL